MALRAPPLAVRACCAAGLALAMAGCTDGYPREDVPSTRQMTVSEHLHALNGYLTGGSVQRRLARQDDCHLVLKKRRDAGQAQRIVIPLLESSVEIATHPAGSGLRVKLTQHQDGLRQVWLRLDLDRWIDAVAWRSHFQQLQLHCRDVVERGAEAP